MAGWLVSLVRDAGFGLRQLRKAPGFAAVVVVTLAVSIGANTAIFSVVSGMLLRPLPYPEPGRLGTLMVSATGAGAHDGEFSEALDRESWTLLHTQVPALDSAVTGEVGGANLKAADTARFVRAQQVSAGYFHVLGLAPLLGRDFTALEDTIGGPNAVLLTYALWQSAFHGDPAVVGHPVDLKGEPYTVIGVLPPAARTPDHAELFTSLRPDTSDQGNGTNYGVIVRLKSGATWQQANAQLNRLRPGVLRQEERGVPGSHLAYTAVPLQHGLTAETRQPLAGLMAAVLVILLIACANLAALALVRVARRTPEIATRLALGASRADILRQLWVEGLLLAALGGVAGLATASVTLRLLVRLIPMAYQPIGGIALDYRVLLFTAAVTLTASLLFGLLPALSTRRVDLRSALTGGSRALAPSGHRLRHAMIAVEVALTIVLLTAAGLIVRSLIHLETLPPGFDANHVMTAKASLDDARYRDPASFLKLIDQTTEAMRGIPGVESAGFGLSLPYERGLNDQIDIVDGAEAGRHHTVTVLYVTPGYMETLRIPILHGRPFTAADTPTSQSVALVNAAFSRQFLGQSDAVGRSLGYGGHTLAVVGTVGDVAKVPGFSSDDPLVVGEPTIYLPASQFPPKMLALVHVWFEPSWVVRTHGEVADLTRRMQQAISGVDANLPVSDYQRMNDLLAEGLLFERLEVRLLGALALLALLLAAVGIYGLVASLVEQRRRELGIRLALGSTVRAAMQEAARSGLNATAVGILLGLVGAAGVGRLIRSQVYGVSVYDWKTLCLVSSLIAGVAILSILIPTLRIARIDPAETLRTE